MADRRRRFPTLEAMKARTPTRRPTMAAERLTPDDRRPGRLLGSTPGFDSPLSNECGLEAKTGSGRTLPQLSKGISLAAGPVPATPTPGAARGGRILENRDAQPGSFWVLVSFLKTPWGMFHVERGRDETRDVPPCTPCVLCTEGHASVIMG